MKAYGIIKSLNFNDDAFELLDYLILNTRFFEFSILFECEWRLLFLIKHVLQITRRIREK